MVSSLINNRSVNKAGKIKRYATSAIFAMILNNCRIKFKICILLLFYKTGSHSVGATHATYDFIVGAGVSGCVVAGRLSERFSVLLLQAGSKPNDSLDIPATVLSLLGESQEYVKAYPSVPQSRTGLANNGTLHYLIGNTLGGGSSVNGMVYNRGSPFDYDNWSTVSGDPSWNYSNLIPYFKRIEDYHGNYFSSEQHWKGGPVPISVSKYAPGLDAWFQVGKHLGYSISGPNGPQKIGFTPLEFSKSEQTGRRMNSYRAYIQPYLESRPHLKVLDHSIVSKILFEGTKAVGVEYRNTQSQQVFKAFATKEVVVSAGNMDSPAILMRSGIGPKDVMEAANISPVKYLPVGKNLQDHVLLKLDFNVRKDKAEVLVPERDLTSENLKIFEETGDGPYSSMNGFHGQAFVTSSVRTAMGQKDWADIQILPSHCSGKLHIILEEEKQEKEIEGVEEVAISMMVLLTRPQSQGIVSINSDSVDDPPHIDFNFLSNSKDMDVLLEGVKLALKIIEDTAPYQAMGARYSSHLFEACSHFTFRSNEYWKCYISYMATTGLHAGGTCRMGKGPTDPNAVVDSTLKVIGVDRLRIVDLSIQPNITNANPQAAAYVIGEKAAQQILVEWEHSTNEIFKQEL